MNSTTTQAIDRSSEQKRLKSKGMIILIALLSAFVPLSTDLYLPALPDMSDFFHAPVSQINLTLSIFMVVYAVGSLLWGPMSDRYGRKPVLVIGLIIYIAASILCAFAWDVTSLIVFRALQAAGGSASGVTATAIVKDVYSGHKRESALAIVQSMVLISPAVAPVIGAFILQVMSWRGVFIVLSVIGTIALIGTLVMTETIQERSTGQVFESVGRLGRVLRNKGLVWLLVVFSIGSISSMAFISSSTFIYQENFHLSNQVYTYFFSFNALAMMAGPMLYLRINRKWHSETIIRACYLAVAVSGLLIFLLGNISPFVFALAIMPSLLANSCSRPPASNMMLEQQKTDTGSVSSIIGCTGLLMGAIGMQIISMPWSNRIEALGVMMFSTAFITLLIWPFAVKQSIRLPGPSALTVEPVEVTND